ncbi:cAMP-dependent protein kinase subunit [Dispira simplex]|nr:cAMP-dependent protein kinase subunit [Dispira simplex]
MTSALASEFHYSPTQVILGESVNPTVENETPIIALLLLNQPVGPKDEIFRGLWERADVRVCADGAANRLYEAFHNTRNSVVATDAEKYAPTIICGDMDSAKEDIVHYFKKSGTTIVHDPDQETTDFMKCLNWIDGYYKEKHLTSYAIVAYGGLGGRFDHTMASISTLYKYAKARPIYLANPGALTFLLTAGTHHIECQWYRQEPKCGILPFAESAIVTTKGLRWNLTQSETSFTGLLSTSNIVNNDSVTVTTDKGVVWTMTLPNTED